MAHNILIPEAIQATNIDALNRSVVGSADIDNGNAFILASKSTTAGEGEVFVATQPATGSLSGLWLAYEPEVVVTVSGNSKYKGIDPDIRNFTNVTGTVFSAFKPKVGDILLYTADGITGTKGSNTYAVAANGQYALAWASAAISGLSLKLLATKYITIGTGAIGSTRVTAYEFEVVAE